MFLIRATSFWGFPSDASGKDPARQCQRHETGGLVWEDPLEEGTATRSSIRAWRIPRTEELMAPKGRTQLSD